MSHAPHSRRLGFSDVADIAAAMRERGDRFSAPRRVVVDALFAADGPVSAEFIAQGLDGRTPQLDLTSVYRALEYLERLGVARHVHAGHSAGLYALTRDTELEYLVCEHCDRVTTVEASRLDPVRAQIRKTFGYEARFTHFPITGLCPRCAASGDAREHEHGDHAHEHSHGDRIHSHPHTHESEHEHEHRH
jgi:Fur family ferric uptake transcriptional regulator